MGSKGGDSPPDDTIVRADSGDNGMYEMMAAMMAMNSSNSVSQPIVEEAPEVQAAEAVDWETTSMDLKNKAKANYDANVESRKGRMDTMHASQDDSDALTTDSLLTD